MNEVVLMQAIKIAADAIVRAVKNNREAQANVDLCVRRIRSTRVSNNLYRELYILREVFLKYDLAGRSDTNERFFNKWLADPVVEMGWTPAGGWTHTRIAELSQELAGVSP